MLFGVTLNNYFVILLPYLRQHNSTLYHAKTLHVRAGLIPLGNLARTQFTPLPVFPFFRDNRPTFSRTHNVPCSRIDIGDFHNKNIMIFGI